MKFIKSSLLIVSSLSIAAPSLGAIVLPNAGDTLVFEAEDYDDGNGVSVATANPADASGGEYVDGLQKSDAGSSATEWFEFDVSNVNDALTYTATVYYRRNGGGINAGDPAELELYSSIDGVSYTFETSTEVAWMSGGWTANFVEEAFDTSFTLDASTTVIRVESLNINDGNGIAHIDRITISAVPEPGSLALLGIGGLLVARRRRG